MMKQFLVVLVLLAAGVVGLGFYRGWFEMTSDKTDPNANVKITYDADKLKEDKDKAKEKLQPKEKTGDNTKDAERRP